MPPSIAIPEDPGLLQKREDAKVEGGGTVPAAGKREGDAIEARAVRNAHAS